MIMREVLAILFTMNLQAVLMILFLLLFRALFRKISKKYICLLWILLVVRLLFPFFVETSFGIVPNAGAVAEIMGKAESFHAALQAGTVNDAAALQENSMSDAGKVENSSKNFGLGQNEPYRNVNQSAKVFWNTGNLLVFLWLGGMAVFLLRYVLQYIHIRKKLRFAVRIEDNIWECDGFSSPFVMGIFKPQIYIPFGMLEMTAAGNNACNEAEHGLCHILQHEKMHIRHHDPLIFYLGMLAACIHWWNPLIWYAVYKMKQDIEMFCDESVLENADTKEKKSYSRTLLQFAVQRNEPKAVLRFGETMAEKRIWHIFYGRKTTLIMKFFLMCFICAFAVLCLTVSNVPVWGMEAAFQNGNKQQEEAVFPGEPVLDEKTFAEQVIAYVRHDDREALAPLINYPFTIRRNGEQIVIASEKEFVENYQQIINEETKQDILKTDVTQLFQNQYGTMMGNGGIWFESFGEKGLLIYAINDMSR